MAVKKNQTYIVEFVVEATCIADWVAIAIASP